MNILLVDDQKTFLESLGVVIHRELPEAKIFTAYSGLVALEIIPNVKPDVILLDVNMPVMNGLEVAEHVTQNYPHIKIIMLTNITGRAMVLSAMKIVHGFLFKDVDGKEIKNAIELVLSGKKHFCANSAKMVVNNMSRLDQLPYVQFTKQEADLVEMIAAGKTSKEMATAFGMKERTVKHHREELLKKTKTKNTNELLAFSVINGVVLISDNS